MTKQVSDKDLYGPFGCGFWARRGRRGRTPASCPVTMMMMMLLLERGAATTSSRTSSSVTSR
jgi:hypothetical protein